jgi:hypothetical protein
MKKPFAPEWMLVDDSRSDAHPGPVDAEIRLPMSSPVNGIGGNFCERVGRSEIITAPSHGLAAIVARRL